MRCDNLLPVMGSVRREEKRVGTLRLGSLRVGRLRDGMKRLRDGERVAAGTVMTVIDNVSCRLPP